MKWSRIVQKDSLEKAGDRRIGSKENGLELRPHPSRLGSEKDRRINRIQHFGMKLVKPGICYWGVDKMTTQEVKQRLYDLGADLCGIASIDRFNGAPSGYHPLDVLPTCQSVIVLCDPLCIRDACMQKRGSVYGRKEHSVRQDGQNGRAVLHWTWRR